MNIKETFLNLTRRTYPHGTEQDLFSLLPENLNKDEFGNLYLQIGENPSTMFTSHLDTASSQVSDVRHQINGNIIKTDGSSILGADDKAGVTVLLFMIQNNIPGLYYFFLGEERGCIGSRKVANKHKTQPFPNIKKVISFDRRGTDSIITYQMGGRCCSESFGHTLADELNKVEDTFGYKVDPTGIYTDSAQFIDVYQECTNISVGYNYEHTSSEYQDIDHLEKLCVASTKVNWENLPVSRNITDIDDDYEDYYYPRNYQKKKEFQNGSSVNSQKSWVITHYFEDPIYLTSNNSVSINKYTNQPVEYELSKARIEYEEDLIYNFLNTMDIDYEWFEWNGSLLTIHYPNENVSSTKRNEIAEYIDELNFWEQLINK